jgi:hypothetical protein
MKKQCKHPHGDHVQGYWLCGTCYAKLHERPTRLVDAHSFKIRDEDTPVTAPQQVVHAEIASDVNGNTLSKFVRYMAMYIGHKMSMTIPYEESVNLAIDILKDTDIPFGSDEYDWSKEGAVEFVDEELQYWEHEKESNK